MFDFIIVLGIIHNDDVVIQTGVFFGGFFGLSSPIKLWQMEGLGANNINFQVFIRHCPLFRSGFPPYQKSYNPKHGPWFCWKCWARSLSCWCHACHPIHNHWLGDIMTHYRNTSNCQYLIRCRCCMYSSREIYFRQSRDSIKLFFGISGNSYRLIKCHSTRFPLQDWVSLVCWHSLDVVFSGCVHHQVAFVAEDLIFSHLVGYTWRPWKDRCWRIPVIAFYIFFPKYFLMPLCRRINAANFYIFLILLAWFGIFAQSLDIAELT